jgi:hypothetical protein
MGAFLSLAPRVLGSTFLRVGGLDSQNSTCTIGHHIDEPIRSFTDIANSMPKISQQGFVPVGSSVAVRHTLNFSFGQCTDEQIPCPRRKLFP